MKKIIFAVAVLGLNCLAYAASSVEKVSETKIFFGCYSQTITQFENSSGEYIYSVAGPRVSTPCAGGQMNGSTTTTYAHQIDPYWDLWPH